MKSEWAAGSVFGKRWRTAIVLIAVVCFVEGLANRDFQYLFYVGSQRESVDAACGQYPHGYTYDIDVDNSWIDIEGYGLATASYALNCKNDGGKDGGVRISYDYPPDKFRMLASLTPSFLLSFCSYPTAVLLANILVWLIGCVCIFWLGSRIFGDARVGTIAGLLCATSVTMIIMSSSHKGEIFQLISPMCLIAAAIYLGHFENELSAAAVANSFILGTLAGVGIFAGGGTVYFVAFSVCYGLFACRFKCFIKRNAVALCGFVLVYALVSAFVRQAPTTDVFVFMAGRQAINWRAWWEAFQARTFHHLFTTVPWQMWVGAFAGVWLLNKQQAKIILPMFSTYVISEIIITASYPYNSYTIAYYYLQILLPIYLLNAQTLYYAIFKIGMRGRLWEKGMALLYSGLFIMATIVTSNLGLIGNKYFYIDCIRPTSIEALYHSYFTYDNMGEYREFR